jgi:peroxiredoxin
MTKTSLIASCFLVGTLLAAGLGLDLRAANYTPASLEGKPAPEIKLKALNGRDLSLADQKGKVVLIDNWATWCPPCKASLPHIQKLSADKSLADKGLVVWAIDAQEPKATVNSFMEDNHYTFTVLLDEKGTTLRNYFISGIPTTIIVGRDGTVKNTFVGYGGDTTAKQIDDAVNQALADGAPR